MPEARWNLSDVGKVLLIFVLLILLARVLGADLSSVVSLPTQVQTVGLMVLVYAVLALLVWYFAVAKYDGTAADLGFRSFDPGRGLTYAVLMLIAVRVAIVFYGIIAGAVGALFGARPPEELVSRVPKLFGQGYWGLVLAIGVGAIIGPLIEELFFRGFLYPALRTRFGVFWGILGSSFIFGLFHVNIWLFVPTALMGAALAYLYERENSLWPPIALHIMSNLVSIVLIYAIT